MAKSKSKLINNNMKYVMYLITFIIILTLTMLGDVIIMYLINHPRVWFIATCIFVALFSLLGLRTALKAYLYDGGIEEDFKAKKEQ